MDIILPDQDVDFRTLVDGMTGEGWRSMFTYRGNHTIDLSLPKFRLETDNDITGTIGRQALMSSYSWTC